MRELIVFVGESLKNKNGIPSSMRIMSFYLVAVLVFSLSFGFICVALFHKDLIIAYAGILSGLISAVLIVKRSEKAIEEKR